MSKFVSVPITEVIENMPESIHRHKELVIKEILSGSQQAYKFNELYVLFESWDNTLMVQCVEGKGLNDEFIKALYRAASNNGFEYIQFVTPHKGLHKMVKALKPERIEYRYICKLDEVNL